VAKSPLGIVFCPFGFDLQDFCGGIARASVLPPPPSEPWPQTNPGIVDDLIEYLDFFRDYLRAEWEATEEKRKAVQLTFPIEVELAYKTRELTTTAIKPVLRKSRHLLEAASLLRLAYSELVGDRSFGCRAVIAVHAKYQSRLDSDLQTLRRELERVRARLNLHVLIVSHEGEVTCSVPTYKVDLEGLVDALHVGRIRTRISRTKLRELVARCSGSPAGVCEELRRLQART